MSNVNIKLGDLLNINDFNPENVDIEELRTISTKVPKDGLVDEAVSDQLAALFLHGADRCGDLLAKAVKWYGYKYTEKNAARTEAMLIRAAQAGHTSNAAQKDFAAADPLFIEASNKEAMAEAWRTWLSNKREIFIKWHHLCKSISERHHQSRYTGDPKMPTYPTYSASPNESEWAPGTVTDALDYLDK